MEDKENKPNLLSCMIKGPGPVYKLPTLVGYVEHDPSRHRSPAFTIRPQTKMLSQVLGPGPCYDVSKLTKYGRDRTPAYTIAGKDKWRMEDLGPGPGAYHPEQCPPMNHNLRPPAYTIKSRSEGKITDDGPGPSAYMLPSCIGPRIPDKIARGAFTIAGLHPTRADDVGPGPAAYQNLNQDLIKRRCPAYSLKWRHRRDEIQPGPGPAYYPIYKCGKRPPMYSFGVRHSECTGVAITAMDED